MLKKQQNCCRVGTIKFFRRRSEEHCTNMYIREMYLQRVMFFLDCSLSIHLNVKLMINLKVIYYISYIYSV